jgi:type II secretory pathway pseudopilin PulG
MLEILIAMIVLSIMAGVIIPNVTTFSNTGNLDAARTEMQNVKTATLGYYGEH